MEIAFDEDLDSLIELINDNDDVSPSTSEPKHKETMNKPTGKGAVQLVDLFSVSAVKSQEALPTASLTSESSVIHTDDTSSDEEEKCFLTKSGEEIKKSIPVIPFYDRCKPKERKTWKSQTSNLSVNKELAVDTLTGIRIVNPLVPFDVLNERMQDRKQIKMSFLDNVVRKGNIDGDWVTFGVLTRKLPPKTSKSGKLFSIWKLSDLHNVEKIVTLFLFGQCHNEHWKNSVGTVIGILNPSVMSPKDKDDGLCITLDHPGKMMLVGKSKDLGYCKGVRRDGEKCTTVVNLSQCEYCVYHVKKEYNKFSKRSEIQTSYSGREPHFKDRILKGQNFFYGGQAYVPLGKPIKKSSNVSTKDKLTLSNLTLKRKATEIFNEEKNKSIKRLAEMYGNDVSIAAENNSEFINNQLVIPSAGSKQLLQHMMKNKAAEKEKDICLISPKDLLKQHERQMKSKMIERANMKNDSMILKNLMPQLGKDLRPGQKISLGFASPKLTASMTSEDYAKLRAIQKVKESGPIERKNPNSINSKPELKRIQAALDSSCEEESASKLEFEESAAMSTGRLGTIDLNSKRIQKILNRKSSHAYEVELAEMEKEAAYFARLEKKEMMEEKLTSTKELVCDVVSCRQCLYTSHHPAERCKTNGHPLKCHKAIKRFFACKDCKRRTECFTKFPKRACRNCGGSNFERTGMMKARCGPKLDSEVLHITNDDPIFLNSLSSCTNSQVPVSFE